MAERTAVGRSRAYLGFALVAGAFSAIVSALIVDGLNDGDWSLGGWEWSETTTAALLLILALLWVAPLAAARIALARDAPVRELVKTSIRNRRDLGEDADFDRLGEGFEDTVYGSSMGDVRLAVILEDVLANIPSLREGRLRVLDVGGGTGRFALQLAALGNEIVLSDPSREMLDRAETAIGRAGLSDSIDLVHARLQDLDRILGKRFEMVACHGVLNWVADPQGALGQLERLLAPGGFLSLTFGTRAAWLFQKILNLDFTDVLSDPDPDSLRAPHAKDVRFPWVSPLPTGWSELGWGASPMPLSENLVRSWLADLGLVVRSKAGVRMFHDYLPELPLTPDRMHALIEVEKALRHTEPFASLAKQVHFVCSSRVVER